MVKGKYLPGSHKKESYVLYFDEPTLNFSNTGERMSFEMLTKSTAEDTMRDKYDQAKTLKEEGKTYQ